MFAAEILFLNIGSASPALVPFDVSLLRDPSRLGERRTDDHKRRVTDAAEQLFPDVPQRQLAEMAFADPSIRRSLQDRVSKALRDRGSTVKIAEVFDASRDFVLHRPIRRPR